jgi:hypothetical protein
MVLAGIQYRVPGWVFLVCYVLYVVSTGLGATYVAVSREVNPPSATAVSVGFYNGGGYVLIAVLTQLIGRILNAYPAIVTASAKIYPPEAYSAIFWMLMGIAVLAMIATLAMRETHGRTKAPEPELA